MICRCPVGGLAAPHPFSAGSRLDSTGSCLPRREASQSVPVYSEGPRPAQQAEKSHSCSLVTGGVPVWPAPPVCVVVPFFFFPSPLAAQDYSGLDAIKVLLDAGGGGRHAGDDIAPAAGGHRSCGNSRRRPWRRCRRGGESTRIRHGRTSWPRNSRRPHFAVA